MRSFRQTKPKYPGDDVSDLRARGAKENAPVASAVPARLTGNKCVVARARSPAKRLDAFLLSRRGGAKIPAPRDPSDARSSPDPRRFTHDLIHDILPGSPLRRIVTRPALTLKRVL